VRGVEIEHSITGQSWSWRSDAILQNPEDLDNGTYLLRRARRSLTTSLTWRDERTSAGLNLLLTGPRSDVGFTTGAPVTDAGYALLAASLRRELGAGFAALVRADNLLDSRYQTASGYNTARRSLYLGLEYASD
jgi:vitamin B12 transporter